MSTATVRIVAALDALQDRDEPVEVHRFVQAVVDRLADQHVVGDADRPGEVLAARRRIGEAGGEQIVGAHAQQLRRHLAPAAEAQDRERAQSRSSASARRTSARSAALA